MIVAAWTQCPLFARSTKTEKIIIMTIPVCRRAQIRRYLDVRVAVDLADLGRKLFRKVV